ncbi:MAG: lysophospholipid acyltransferase family protein [Pseudolysinimonas sp.]
MPAQMRDRFTSPWQANARFVAQRGLLKGVVWAMLRVSVVDRDKLKNVKRPFVVVANHSSHLDAPLIMGALPRSLARYLAAGAAGDYFFDVWWRRGLTALFFNAFPVDRSGNNPRNVSAKTLLEHDVPVLVFPEGTRSKDGVPGHFKPGAAALSSATGAPILPIAIIGAHQSHPRGSKWPKSGQPVAVVFGAPMKALPDENPTEFMARVRTQVVAMHTEHTPRILDPKRSAPKRVKAARAKKEKK